MQGYLRNLLSLTGVSVIFCMILIFLNRQRNVHPWLFHLSDQDLPTCVERNVIDDTPTKTCINESAQSVTDLQNRIGWSLHDGGKFEPRNCIPSSHVAILVPYRDRDEHLGIFLNHMHPFLQKQNIFYGIYVVEIDHSTKFNRALLINVGFVEALKEHRYACVVIHDVDLLPEDYRIPYTCPKNPTQLSKLISSKSYKLPYLEYFGGVSIVTTEQYKQVNGMSNVFFGYAGEDDEFWKRLQYYNWSMSRPPGDIPRFTMLKHEPEKDPIPSRYCLIENTDERSKVDGLNSLKYTLLKKEHKPLYTWILVRVNATEIIEGNAQVYPFYKKCV